MQNHLRSLLVPGIVLILAVSAYPEGPLVSPDASYQAQLQAAGGLSRDATAVEVDAAYITLNTLPVDQSLPETALASVKNALLDRLLLQKELPPDLAQRLVGWYKDAQQGVVFRDYCLQFLALIGERRLTESPGDHPDLVLAREHLASALEAPELSFPGTALLGLERLALAGNDENRAQLGGQVIKYAANPSASDPTRLTALQIAVRLGDTNALPIARLLLETSSSTPLRLSAIATVGELGGESDASLLGAQHERAVGHFEQRASESALRRLKERNATGGRIHATPST